MSDSLTMFKKLQEGGQPCSAWTISFIKEQSVWTSKAFYLKSPTYKAPTSKKELGFYTVPFKSSVHNWASLMVFEKNSDFFFFFFLERKNKSSLAHEEVSFSSSNQVSSRFRQSSEWFASTRKRQQMAQTGHSEPQSGSGPIQHMYAESRALCWAPRIQDGEDKMLSPRSSWWALTRPHFLEKDISSGGTFPHVTYNRKGHIKNRSVPGMALWLSTAECPWWHTCHTCQVPNTVLGTW